MKKAVQFGAGNIGRGFIGALLEQSGYHVVFADVNEKIINKINEDGRYTVKIMDSNLSENIIKNISGVLSSSDAAVDEILQSEIITTAVGLTILPYVAPAIAKGISKRFSKNIQTPLNIIACENAIRASSQLKTEVMKHLSDEEKKYTEVFVGFPDCSVDRIVPPVKCENFIDVVVENYHEWNVERSGFVGEIPKIFGMNVADELMAYIERKLFTLNTGHAITAYFGNLMGYKTIDESIADTQIAEIVREAMTESGMGLIQKYGFDKETHFQYIDKIIKRFKNPYLQDDVFRVGREPIRKLSDSDRLIRPLVTANDYGLPIDNLLLGVGAALCYNNPDDGQSVRLQRLIKENGVATAIAEIAHIPATNVLAKKIETAYYAVQEIIL